jgi:histidinol-phosphate aminotransferase
MKPDTTRFFRSAIAAMDGYVPGEQPKDKQYVKLNTNENPYPPSPKVAAALKKISPADFRRYADPVSDALRETAAEVFGVTRAWILAGNGSDDILTIAVRSFVDQGGSIATLDPAYSLYPVLADIQGAKTVRVPLTGDYALPEDLLSKVNGADILFITRPNAPTGHLYPLYVIEEICEKFDGIVFIDEAYADFSEDNCLHLVRRFDNVIVSRSMSKSYALAGLRLGFAVATPTLIEGMMKVKDSYNINAVSQYLGAAALRDQDYLKKTVGRIIATRRRVFNALADLGFEVVPSDANFLFANPPACITAKNLFERLREAGILVRYFAHAPNTREHVRVTIGTDDEMDKFLTATARVIGR